MQDKSMNASLKLLLDIAKEMIVEKGCRATTLQDIADRGGLTKGAIYHYVKSKDELFAMILEEGLKDTNELFFESVAQASGVEGPLGTISKRLRSAVAVDSVISLIFIYLLSQKDKPEVASILKRYHETAVQTSARWIEVGQQHGVIPAHIDAQKVARMLAVFKNGLQVQHILSEGEAAIDDREIFEFMLHALGGNPKPEDGAK